MEIDEQKQIHQKSKQNELLEQIHTLKKKLYEIADHKGFQHNETLKISSELDHLIYVYQKFIYSRKLKSKIDTRFYN